MATYRNGAFVFTRARGLEPRLPSEVAEIAARHGIPASDIPPYAGDLMTFSRAVKRVTVAVSRDGWLIRPIRQPSRATSAYGIVRERTTGGEHLEHAHEATVSWAAEPDASVVTGDHEIAGRVRDTYHALRGKIVADDWGPAISAALGRAGAAPVRDDGRIYWVPPQKLEDARKLGAFLSDVGIDLVLCEIEPEAVTVVQQAAQVSLDDELERLAAEAADFDGKQKPTTYELRLQQYGALRQRALLYRDALGLGADRAKQILDGLEAKVGRMLDVRLRSTVRKDGTLVEGRKCQRGRARVEPVVESEPAAAPAAPAPEPTLSFNNVRYELVSVTHGTLDTWIFAPPAPQLWDAALVGALGRSVPLGAGRLQAARQDGEERVCLLVTAPTLESCAAGLRQYGIEIAK